ncbi:YbfB/YjiJ family MFS transporter [Paraglaciecola agarilytica]|uniref:YbfB/YjiJ family MFS transporter n=1 Tax=Paraglaciecola chathamensis TaxID=368405 RepID=UPI00235530D5|nr:YbfB/YjiJ family MFS transporter [Paraglaciecola agarilytica]
MKYLAPGIRSAIDAALVMAVGMGFGRFAYTALYPHMVQDDVLSLSGGSLAASANYAGYLIGALVAIRARPANSYHFCLWATAGTAACLAVLALIETTWAIVVVRGIAGVFSAVSMVAASLWLLEYRKHLHGAPLLYAGVGVGIALSAELVVLAAQLGLNSHGLWLTLGISSLVLGGFAAQGLKSSGQGDLVQMPTTSNGDDTVGSVPLVMIYGLAGFGYIITATYLPLLVKTALPDVDSAHVWAVFGLGAAPSCFLWHRIHLRLSTQKSLALNLGVQACGVVLPVLLPNGVGYLASALLVGGTFMGTVTIAMPAAQRIAHQARGNLLATMTIIYSIGQIIGPLVASSLYSVAHGFSGSLWAAGVALVIGACMSLVAL